VPPVSPETGAEYLTTTFPDVPRERMLVGLEFAGHHGFTFAHYLAQRGYQVVNVLPSVTKRLKEVEDNSPQKDDAKDAAQICRLAGQGYYVAFPLLDDRGAELRLLATERHRLGVEAVRLRNRLHAALDLGWPEFGGQFSELDKVTPLALLERWPTATALAQAAPRAVHALVKRASRNHISPERIRALITSAHETVALTEGTGDWRTAPRAVNFHVPCTAGRPGSGARDAVTRLDDDARVPEVLPPAPRSRSRLRQRGCEGPARRCRRRPPPKDFQDRATRGPRPARALIDS